VSTLSLVVIHIIFENIARNGCFSYSFTRK